MTACLLTVQNRFIIQTTPNATEGKQIMRPIVLVFFLVTILFAVGPIRETQAQNLGRFVESYTARLSSRDHFNSNGERLRAAAAIVRQDRANFYVYGLRDEEDEPDSFFSAKSNRARLEQLLDNGQTTREAVNRVVNGTPLIRVDIYGGGITVTIVSD